MLCACSVSVQLLATPWTVAHQAPLSMEFSKQEYWSDSRESHGPRHQTCISCISRWILNHYTTREAPFSFIGYYKMLTVAPRAIQ